MPARFARGASCRFHTISSTNKERIEARERQHAAEITVRLQEQFAHDQAEADAKAKAEIDIVRQEAASALEHERQNAAARAAAAREESRQAPKPPLSEHLPMRHSPIRKRKRPCVANSSRRRRPGLLQKKPVTA